MVPASYVLFSVWGDHFTWQSEVFTPYTKQHMLCRDHREIKIKKAAVSCNILFHLKMASSS
jgi:hypothetical protein